MFVDSNCVGDKVSYRLKSDIVLHINTTPMQWLSGKQTTVEISVFDIKILAMKQGMVL